MRYSRLPVFRLATTLPELGKVAVKPHAIIVCTLRNVWIPISAPLHFGWPANSGISDSELTVRVLILGIPLSSEDVGTSDKALFPGHFQIFE